MQRFLLLFFLVNAAYGFNEAPCRAAGGYCMYSSKCPGGQTLSGKCPRQSRSITCCLSAPYNEAPCQKAGGSCSESCSNGKSVSGKCPTQDAGIKCCIPNQGSGAGSSTSATCSSLGGVCQSFSRCSNLVVSGLCPGSSSQKCCVPSSRVDDYDRHLSKAEGGLFLKGYIPSSGSGVTIATGVDLGQQSVTGLRGKISSSLLNKLKPYIGLKTRNSVHNAGLNEKNLRLSLNEAIELDAVFKAAGLKRFAAYDNRMSLRGKVVMLSLTHWCYNVTDKYSDGKCYHRRCTNYLRNALIGKRATDADLKRALINQKYCLQKLGEPSWKIARLNTEINYL